MHLGFILADEFINGDAGIVLAFCLGLRGGERRGPGAENLNGVDFTESLWADQRDTVVGGVNVRGSESTGYEQRHLLQQQ